MNDQMTGRRLGDFGVVRELGRGNMGVGYTTNASQAVSSPSSLRRRSRPRLVLGMNDTANLPRKTPHMSTGFLPRESSNRPGASRAPCPTFCRKSARSPAETSFANPVEARNSPQHTQCAGVLCASATQAR